VNTSSTVRWLPHLDLGLDDDLTPAPSGRTIRSFRMGLTPDICGALKAARRCTFLPFWVANKGAGCSELKSNDRFWHKTSHFRAATIRPLSEMIRKLAERPSHRRLWHDSDSPTFRRRGGADFS
jgi:hypothetical protein